MANVAAVSLAIGYPTAASVPHSIVNGFKVCLASPVLHWECYIDVLLVELVGSCGGNGYRVQGSGAGEMVVRWAAYD